LKDVSVENFQAAATVCMSERGRMGCGGRHMGVDLNNSAFARAFVPP
jgi:hypothetical protein